MASISSYARGHWTLVDAMRLAQDGVPYTGQGVLSGFFVNTPAICASFYNLRTWRMKIFLFVLAATIFEAAGEAIVRIAIRPPSWWVVPLLSPGAYRLLGGEKVNNQPRSRFNKGFRGFFLLMRLIQPSRT